MNKQRRDFLALPILAGAALALFAARLAGRPQSPPRGYCPHLFLVEIGRAAAYHEDVPDADQCSADAEEVAERYVMESLPDAGAVVFEEHVSTCAPCRAAVRGAGVYVRAMRAAAAQLRNGNSEGGEPAGADAG